MNPIDPFSKFQSESTSLMRASVYLLKLQVAIMQDEGHHLSGEHRKLTERLGPAYEDPHQYFMSRLFVGHVAAFEIFLQDLLAVVISKHPMKLGATQFKLADILEAESTDALIRRAIAESANQLMYKKPMEYRDAVADILSIDVSRIDTPWKVLVEAKARRDIGVHADWVCNETYIRKLQEGGIDSTFKVGDSTVPDTEEYFQEVIDGLDVLAGRLTNHVLEHIFQMPLRVPEEI